MTDQQHLFKQTFNGLELAANKMSKNGEVQKNPAFQPLYKK
jgi:hypothetical protein